jgi:hypothetical protein
MLDVRGTLAIENEEKVVYVKCHLGQQLVSVARTLPWQCNYKGHPIVLRIRLVLPLPSLFTRIENVLSQYYCLGESFSYAEPAKITA